MIATLCFITQVWAIVAGLIQCITVSVGRGIVTAGAVIVFHLLIGQLTNLSLWIHQKSMSEYELSRFTNKAELSFRFFDDPPPQWKTIGTAWALVFLIISNIFILARF